MTQVYNLPSSTFLLSVVPIETHTYVRVCCVCLHTGIDSMAELWIDLESPACFSCSILLG